MICTFVVPFSMSFSTTNVSYYNISASLSPSASLGRLTTLIGLGSGTNSDGREIAHRHIFSHVKNLILPSRHPMRCGFGREVAHRHIFSDVNNFLVREPPPPEGFDSSEIGRAHV